MIDGIVAGTLHRTAQARTSSAGKRYATAIVRAALRDGSTIFASVIAFSESTVAALLALESGDAVALAGEITPKIYQPKDGGEPRASIDVLAHACLTAYAVQRKRKAITAAKTEAAPAGAAHSVAHSPAAEGRDFDDPIPF